jgi:hypothetical protein
MTILHRNIIPNYSQQDAMFVDVFISTDALHVSSDSSAHHQAQTTVQTVSGIVNQYLMLYVQLCAPDDGRRNHLKHVEHLWK